MLTFSVTSLFYFVIQLKSLEYIVAEISLPILRSINRIRNISTNMMGKHWFLEFMDTYFVSRFIFPCEIPSFIPEIILLMIIMVKKRKEIHRRSPKRVEISQNISSARRPVVIHLKLFSVQLEHAGKESFSHLYCR